MGATFTIFDAAKISHKPDQAMLSCLQTSTLQSGHCRALAEFATQAGTSQAEATKLVNDFLGSLTSFDVVLARAARDKTAVPAAADQELAQALKYMDR